MATIKTCEDCGEQATWLVVRPDLERRYFCWLHHRFYDYLNVTQIVPVNPPLFLERPNADRQKDHTG